MPLPAIITLSGTGTLTAWHQPPIQGAYVQRSNRPAMSSPTTYDPVGRLCDWPSVGHRLGRSIIPLAAGPGGFGVFAANHALGDISRLTFQISSSMLETEAMQRSISLLGTELAPAVQAILVQRPDHG